MLLYTQSKLIWQGILPGACSTRASDERHYKYEAQKNNLAERPKACSVAYKLARDDTRLPV